MSNAAGFGEAYSKSTTIICNEDEIRKIEGILEDCRTDLPMCWYTLLLFG